MNVLVRMRYSHALRLVPSWYWWNAAKALTKVSCTRSSASAGLRVSRSAAEYSWSRNGSACRSNRALRCSTVSSTVLTSPACTGLAREARLPAEDSGRREPRSGPRGGRETRRASGGRQQRVSLGTRLPFRGVRNGYDVLGRTTRGRRVTIPALSPALIRTHPRAHRCAGPAVIPRFRVVPRLPLLHARRRPPPRRGGVPGDDPRARGVGNPAASGPDRRAARRVGPGRVRDRATAGTGGLSRARRGPRDAPHRAGPTLRDGDHAPAPAGRAPARRGAPRAVAPGARGGGPARARDQREPGAPPRRAPG